MAEASEAGSGGAAARPLPDLDDPILQGFWEHTAKHELVVQECESCGAIVWPPRPGCPTCLSSSMTWKKVDGTGSLFSWTVIHHAALPYFASKTPYAVGIIELPGVPVRMIGDVRVADPTELSIGMAMTVGFETVADCTLPYWEPASSGR